MHYSDLRFTIKCPICSSVFDMADAVGTDDWDELLIFSGYSRKSEPTFYRDYVCPNCNAVIDRDMLYAKKCITVESPQEVKNLLSGVVRFIVEGLRISDHGWEPDVEAAANRYAMLFPDDKDFEQIKNAVSLAYRNPKMITKFQPSYVTIIREGMVAWPKLLQKVYLPDSVKEIDDKAFFGCTALSDIYIPKKVERIGKSAFENCGALKTIHTSDSLEIIDDRAFKGCALLEKCYFPDAVKKIGEESFAGCKSLSTVFIPEKCVDIAQNAFLDCDNLVICGKASSFAEKYAQENNFVFIEK